ncbi:MAG: hypothetical protein ACFCUT_07315 [Kiloniellaceae bacterium]
MIATRLATLVLAAGLLAACGHQVQTTSGSQYLAAYAPTGPQSQMAGTIDADIAAVADVEPQLRFPARLGLARIENGTLTPVPHAEAEAWQALAERLGSGYGTFLPVSPLIAALAADEKAPRIPRDSFRSYQRSLTEVVRAVRRGAARQHLDAVLIYEPFGKSEETSNPLAITKIALIGFFLPTEDIEAEGSAQAVLVDVRNGYTYGTAAAIAEKPAYRLASSGNTHAARRAAEGEAQTRAVANLTGEVEAMLRELRLALAERRSGEALR